MMKFLLALVFLVPSVAFCKTLTFTPIGEDLSEIYGSESTSLSLEIEDISRDGSEVLLLLTDSTSSSLPVKKNLKWDSVNGLTSLQDYESVSIRLGEGFYPNNTINIIKDSSETQFTYQTEHESLVVTTSDVQSDFFGVGTDTQIQRIRVASKFGNNFITGTVVGQTRGPNGLGAFIWSKDTGFINVNDNDKTDIPICNWDNCFLNILTGDAVGRGIAGNIQGGALYMDIKNQSKVYLARNGFERGRITKLSSNGEFAIVSYSDNNLTNTSAIYDINNDTYKILPPVHSYHWYFGETELSVQLTDVSDSGSLAVGYYVERSVTKPVIWTPALGVRELTEYVASEYGVDLLGWSFLRATHVSPNGQYIYGVGNTTDGKRRAWRMELIRVCESPDW